MDGGTLEHHGKPGKLRDWIFHVSCSSHLSISVICFYQNLTRMGFAVLCKVQYKNFSNITYIYTYITKSGLYKCYILRLVSS